MKNLLYEGDSEELQAEFKPSWDPMVNFLHVLRVVQMFRVMETIELGDPKDTDTAQVNPYALSAFNFRVDSLLALNRWARKLIQQAELN